MDLPVSEVSFPLVLQHVLGYVEANLGNDDTPPRLVKLRLAVHGPDFVAQESCPACTGLGYQRLLDRKSTRLNSSHLVISYAVFCLKKKKDINRHKATTQTSRPPINA